MKKLGNRKEITTEFCYSVDNKMLQTLYVDKNTSGKENVKVLSTMYKDVTVTRNQRKKNNIIVLYDHAKGRADIVDLTLSKLSVRMKSRRCILNILAFFLDTVPTDAKTVLKKASNKSPSTASFTWYLGRMLVTTSD